MFLFFLKKLSNRNGKTSKPNLAVILLFFIVIIQSYFLFKAYGPKGRHVVKVKVAVKPIAKIPSLPAPPTVPTSPTIPNPQNGKIALIIDDSGYNRKDCDHLAAIQVPVTISILPQLAHSTEVAECANAQGKEVMLHLPLEPHVFREQYPSDYFIKTAMTSKQITNRLAEAIKSVPHLAGVNNHEGSKATEDSRVMYLIFKELAKKNLFFVDSRVTNKSVCKNLAEKLNLPFTGRDIFLDNVNERAAIEKEFGNLAAKAKQRGTAVAIGHARVTSWPVITEQVKALAAQGYEFVTVHEMIQAQHP